MNIFASDILFYVFGALVYAGAIMVLFAFIIMLLNVKQETTPFSRPFSVAIGVIIACLFLGQLIGIIYSLPGAKETHRCPMASAEQAWNDLKIGQEDAAPSKTGMETPACSLPPPLPPMFRPPLSGRHHHP